MLNLHAIANRIIVGLHPNETVTLYQSLGQSNVRGKITQSYAAPQTVEAQIQDMSSEELAQQYEVNQTRISRKAYLFSDTATALIPRGIYRPLARNGDIIVRADGGTWLVVTLMEDFSKSGWCCVGITEQLEGISDADIADADTDADADIAGGADNATA